MPLFLCRWRSGDCSVVLARTKADVIVELDQAPCRGAWRDDRLGRARQAERSAAT
jgi:hypothetical protein